MLCLFGLVLLPLNGIYPAVSYQIKKDMMITFLSQGIKYNRRINDMYVYRKMSMWQLVWEYMYMEALS